MNGYFPTLQPLLWGTPSVGRGDLRIIVSISIYIFLGSKELHPDGVNRATIDAAVCLFFLNMRSCFMTAVFSRTVL